MQLAGLLIVRNDPRRRWRAARREWMRAGLLTLLDAAAFRAYARLAWHGHDERWTHEQLARLRGTYPADVSGVPTLRVSSPNSCEAEEFLHWRQPDLVIARCKVLLKPRVFNIARAGTFVLHPGICPEYRNAHGCFWALVNRDFDHVGMTLLRVDSGVDTGPVYLHAACSFDERRESHTVIQHRAVFDNLEAIGRTLTAIAGGADLRPVETAGRRSAVWGQPRLTKYILWKYAARREQRTGALAGCVAAHDGRPGDSVLGRPETTEALQ